MRTERSAESLRRMAADLVEKALKAGAEEAEVHVAEGTEFSVDVRLGRIENLIQAGSRSVDLRVILDRRTAHASSSDLSKDVLNGLVRRAVERARLAEPDPCAGLPESGDAPPDPSTLGIYDPELSSVEPRTKIETAMLTEKLALEDRRITNSQGASLETNASTVILANSKGFLRDYGVTHCSLSLGLQAGGTNDRVEDFWFSSGVRWKDLASPEAVARTAVERTVRLLRPKKIKTQRLPVLFEPLMTSWLMGFLFSCVSGTAVFQKATFLADRRGEKVGNGLVTVLDDGLLPGLPGTRPFDAEGVPCRRTTVMDQGVLKRFLCDVYASRKLGLKSTGNADGGGVGPNNFYLRPGGRSAEDIIASTDRGLLIVKTLGHGLNPVTGEVSRGAFGLWVEKGEISFPVSEITISGNLERILNDIQDVGSDLDLALGLSGPTIKIGEMTVAGT
ncbi:MAG: TldD/PmbA family protein [Candidatus Aminicenantes bacterium]|nr:TldD/PmbA family protein [Candidatus Aminicenantes bacterium]